MCLDKLSCDISTNSEQKLCRVGRCAHGGHKFRPKSLGAIGTVGEEMLHGTDDVVLGSYVDMGRFFCGKQADAARIDEGTECQVRLARS